MKNPRTRNVDEYIDCDILLGEEWVPFTTRPDGDTKETYDKLKNGEAGEIEILPPIRNVEAKYREVLSAGVLYNNQRLLVTDVDERERISAAIVRYSVKGELPGGKEFLNYPLVDGGEINLLPEEIVDAGSAIQDYIEHARTRRDELLEDEILDINTGWPE